MMSIRIEKTEADKGQYSYCFYCGGLVDARFPQGVILRATAVIESPTLVTLPSFCECSETPETQLWRVLAGIQKGE